MFSPELLVVHQSRALLFDRQRRVFFAGYTLVLFGNFFVVRKRGGHLCEVALGKICVTDNSSSGVDPRELFERGVIAVFSQLVDVRLRDRQVV